MVLKLLDIEKSNGNNFILFDQKGGGLWDFSGVYLFNIIFKFPELIVVNNKEILVINLLSHNLNINRSKNLISKSEILLSFLENPTYEIKN